MTNNNIRSAVFVMPFFLRNYYNIEYLKYKINRRILKKIYWFAIVAILVCLLFYSKAQNITFNESVQQCGQNLNDTQTEFPWAVQLIYQSPNDENVSLCAGSLISKNYVLTVAHCVDPWQMQRIRHIFLFVRIKEENQTTDLPVESVLIHNDYDKESISRVNDLALVKITGKNERIQPICLPFLEDMRKKSYSNYSFISISKENSLTYNFMGVSNDECANIYANTYAEINSKQLCATGPNACNGDSGSALIWKNTLVGALSFGPLKCNKKNWPVVYTRIDRHLDWILEQNIFQ